MSSLTLFRAVADESLSSDIDAILDTASTQGFAPCPTTAAFLADG